MPELPEIETVRRKLIPQILNKKLLRITLRRKDLRFPIPENLSLKFKDQTVHEIRRRSKYLLIDFKNQWTLIIHLGMSGRLYFTNPKNEFHKHDHVIFDFNNGLQLRLRDPRRFGILTMSKTSEVNQHKLFHHLGVEPLQDEFNANYLYEICHKSVSPIKNILMNAKYVVGVGNIYATEALFLSGVRPQRLGIRITKKESQKICEQIKYVLQDSIQLGGTTFRDFVDSHEQPGLHQLKLRVYQRMGKSCPICRQTIKRLIQGGRSSFYCPQCQT